MGNVIFTNVKFGPMADRLYASGTVNLAAVYATGGDTVSPSDLKMINVDSIVFSGGLYFLKYDPVTKLILAYESNGPNVVPVEITAADDLSGINMQFFALGN